MKKILIFGAGFLAGVVTGTVVTVLCYDHQKKKKEKELSEKPDGVYSDHIVTTDVDEMRHFYIQGLRDLGINVWDVDEDGEYDNNFEEEDRQASIVNPIEDDEEPEEEESDSYPVEPNPEPYEIPDHAYGTREFYDSETLMYYKGDSQMTDANYEFVIDWQQHVGNIEDRLNKEDKDEIYIRNEVEQTDYQILIYADSYAHAIEGEEPLGDMAD
jgi:hypothetical protein